MTRNFILVWCISYLYFKTDAGKPSRYLEELLDDGRCNFDASLTYNVTDLLRCMSVFMIGLSAEDNVRTLRQPSESNPLAYRENPYELSLGNVVSNLFSNGIPSINDYFPLDPAAGQYQLDRPVAPADPLGQFGGLGANLYDALSSISRYDDSKCVSRILCEMASGRPPGEYKQASSSSSSSYLGDLGRNALSQWLVGLDVAGTSPMLNFARAAALGYSSWGDPAACYRAFPRCPRNPDKLLHYLNNHNGGFFRFFGGYGRGGNPQQSYASQGNSKFLRGRKRKALPPGYAGAVADRTGTGELKFDVPVLSAQRDYGKSSFQKENISESSRRVVFPVHEEPSEDRPSGDRIPKSSSGYESTDANASSRNNPPFFFPQDSEDPDIRVSRFAPYLSDSESRTEFHFPR
ncbi:PREDICTED: uncharacterized protein LOC106744356 [Dinoponera quadriceps]|uniref:Uncharacterized protein LOC106744356 n=1 Tax=Dinoponera quadriceps TaxID=609295 RepID=A0A6P3X7Z5_DINQU|nr:PREDICTED: uncharacterized protein LOC106744356 [Dinoponera quadriceps]